MKFILCPFRKNKPTKETLRNEKRKKRKEILQVNKKNERKLNIKFKMTLKKDFLLFKIKILIF